MAQAPAHRRIDPGRLGLAVGLGTWFYVNSVLSSITRFQVAGITPETPGGPIDILLVGSDSRAFVSDPGQVAAFGNPLTQSGQRSDVIIVLRLVPSTRQIEMLSIPRDTYVPIPGTGGSNRINAAFNTGPNRAREDHPAELRHPHQPRRRGELPGFRGDGERPRRHLPRLPGIRSATSTPA